MNTDKIRFLSFDLDGTLLNHQKQISPYSLQILTRLQKKGYIIILNSGRFYHEVEPNIEQLQMKLYGGYVICSNGCVVYDIQAGSTHTFPTIDYKDAKRLFQIAKQKKIMTYLYFHQDYHLYAPFLLRILFSIAKACIFVMHPFLSKKLQHLTTRVTKQKIASYQRLETFSDIEKMCFLGFPFQLRSFWKDVSTAYAQFHYFEVNRLGIEIVQRGVSKAEAVRFLCEQHEATLENVMAFGDSGNDLALLTEAGIGVVMKNAKQIVMNASPYKTEFTNQQDGVCKFLEKELLSM